MSRSPPNHSALLRICMMTYNEALQNYSMSFALSMYSFAVPRLHNYADLRLLRSRPLLRFVEHIHFRFWDVSCWDVSLHDMFLSQVEKLAEASKEDRGLQTCRVKFHPDTGCFSTETCGSVKLRCEEAIASFDVSEEEGAASRQLYRKMLDVITNRDIQRHHSDDLFARSR